MDPQANVRIANRRLAHNDAARQDRPQPNDICCSFHQRLYDKVESLAGYEISCYSKWRISPIVSQYISSICIQPLPMTHGPTSIADVLGRLQLVWIPAHKYVNTLHGDHADQKMLLDLERYLAYPTLSGNRTLGCATVDNGYIQQVVQTGGPI